MFYINILKSCVDYCESFQGNKIALEQVMSDSHRKEIGLNEQLDFCSKSNSDTMVANSITKF